MRLSKLCIRLIPALFLFSHVLLADSVTLNNPSFENNDNVNPKIDCQKEPGCWYAPQVIQDWIVENGAAGTFQPGPGSNREFDLPLPDGAAVAYVTGGAAISQTLSATVEPNNVYTLKVDVGQRRDWDDGCCAFAGYTIALYAGSTPLASSSAPAPAVRGFVTATVTYTSPASDNNIIGQPLIIRLSANDSDPSHHVYFDNVRLTGTDPQISDFPFYFWW